MKTNSSVRFLEENVIKGGYCIGCGICASVKNSHFKIELDDELKLQAVRKETREENGVDYTQFCPFSGQSLDEDELGKELFSDHCTYADKVGFYHKTYAGYVVDDKFREKGSSGGFGSWMIHELLRLKMIDGAIHVHSTAGSQDPKLFKYHISTSTEAILAGAKSRYYPIELSEVLSKVRESKGKFAVVGLPCYIKALRLLEKEDCEIKNKIIFHIGLVCGHLKSGNFASMLAWQAGILPGTLKEIDFRTKVDNENANNYAFTAKGLGANGEVREKSMLMSKVFGADWGWGLFKYNACDYCDDVLAETADMVVGDAWLKRYLNDSQGTNVIVVRNQKLSELIENAHRDERIKLDVLPPSEVIQSQYSGLFHRREGLAYRQSLDKKNKVWFPEKRIKPKKRVMSHLIRRRMKYRIDIARLSHINYNKAVGEMKFESFKDSMEPLILAYKKTYRITFKSKVKIQVKKWLKIK